MISVPHPLLFPVNRCLWFTTFVAGQPRRILLLKLFTGKTHD